MAGVIALAIALGSLHAFSVILAPLEQQVGTGRAAVSLVYAAAIVALTAGVLVSNRLLSSLSPARTAVTVASVATIGLSIAAASTTYLPLLIGFGAMFGLANGVGYSLFLRQASVAMPVRSGLAIGIATAAYAMGAMVFSWVLASLAAAGDARPALFAMAAGVALAGAIGWKAFDRSLRAPSTGSGGVRTAIGHDNWAITGRLWLIYLLGATGGLMSIAHAGGIVASLGGSSALVAQSAVAFAAGNAAGSLLGGVLVDRLPVRVCLAGTILAGGLASLGLAGATSAMVAIGLLVVAGVAYGALIALIPAAVPQLVAASEAASVFNRVFTAWGVAGLAGPWIAGEVYDRTAAYHVALLIAAALAMLGAWQATTLIGRSPDSE